MKDQHLKQTKAWGLTWTKNASALGGALAHVIRHKPNAGSNRQAVVHSHHQRTGRMWTSCSQHKLKQLVEKGKNKGLFEVITSYPEVSSQGLLRCGLSRPGPNPCLHMHATRADRLSQRLHGCVRVVSSGENQPAHCSAKLRHHQRYGSSVGEAAGQVVGVALGLEGVHLQPQHEVCQPGQATQ